MLQTLFTLPLLFTLLSPVSAGGIISDPNNPPVTSEQGQSGFVVFSGLTVFVLILSLSLSRYNNCAHWGDSPTSECQTVYINNVEDFCLFAPPARSPATPLSTFAFWIPWNTCTADSTISDTEQYEVAHCTHTGHGARLMPAGTLRGVHVVPTPHYIQVTGVGDFTKIE